MASTHSPNIPRPLDALEATIRQRATELQDDQAGKKSYTAKLLQGDLAKLCGKVTEEAAELVEAAEELADGEPTDERRSHFIHEAGDLLYHMLVLMRRHDFDVADLEAELARRFGMSGLEEKASRKDK